MGIYWNKDAKTEAQEPRAAAKPKTAPRPKFGLPLSGTRAWTSTLGPDAADETDKTDKTDPNRARERGPGKG